MALTLTNSFLLLALVEAIGVAPGTGFLTRGGSVSKGKDLGGCLRI